MKDLNFSSSEINASFWMVTDFVKWNSKTQQFFHFEEQDYCHTINSVAVLIPSGFCVNYVTFLARSKSFSVISDHLCSCGLFLYTAEACTTYSRRRQTNAGNMSQVIPFPVNKPFKCLNWLCLSYTCFLLQHSCFVSHNTVIYLRMCFVEYPLPHVI